MLYERLVHIYNSTDCHNQFPNSTVDNLYRFIQQTLDQRKKNVSPYGFAKYAGLSVDKSIQFLMYFSNKDSIFDIEYFFECSRSTCGNRIYLEPSDLQSVENMVTCDDCSKDYVIGDIQEFIKAYFTIRREFLSNIPRFEEIQKRDPNSTFQAMKGLPDDLKPKSPSSLDSHRNGDDGGDFSKGVPLDSMAKANIDDTGRVISSAVQSVLDNIIMRYE